MDEAALRVDGTEIQVGAHRWLVQHPVCDAAIVGGRVLVLYAHDPGPGGAGQFRNLEAFTLEGEPVWTAQHPTQDPEDCYVDVVSWQPLRVNNRAGYECELDAATGRLLRTVFTR